MDFIEITKSLLLVISYYLALLPLLKFSIGGMAS